MNTEGTRTGRMRTGVTAEETAEALQRAARRLQAAGACIRVVDPPGSLRAALGPITGAELRHAEERVLAAMLDPEFAPVDPKAFKGLPAAMYGMGGLLRCPWDDWKPGRDIA